MGFLKVLLEGLLLAVFLAILMGIAEQCFSGKKVIDKDIDGKRHYRWSNLATKGWGYSLLFGLLVGVINYFTPGLRGYWLWLAPVFYLTMGMLYVYMMTRWKKTGRLYVGMLLYIAIAFVITFTMVWTAYAVAELLGLSGWLKGFAVTLPWVLMVVTIGFFIINTLQDISRNHRRSNDVDVQSKGRFLRYVSWGVMALATLVIAIILFDGVNGNLASIPVKTLTASVKGGWKPKPPEESSSESVPEESSSIPEEPEVPEEPEKELDPRFVQEWTGNDRNDLDDQFSVKLSERAKENDGVITAEMVVEELLNICGHDARMLAIWAHTCDAEKLWPDPNKYEELLTSDKTYLSEKGIALYYELKGFFAASIFTREEAPAGGLNSRYENGEFIVAGEPGISGDRTGTKIETPAGDEIWVMDRCANIVKKPDPPDDPDDPPDEPKKDPTQGTQGDPVKPNDDPGPGPNTNNSENPNKSTEDTGSRSTDGSKEEYDQEIEELEEANEVTDEGGEPNTPTTTPEQVIEQLDLPESTPVNVDNNGDTGTPTSDPIDTPTPVAPPAEIVLPDGETTPITEEPGESWGGPPD